jgi:hypothetical protein
VRFYSISKQACTLSVECGRGIRTNKELAVKTLKSIKEVFDEFGIRFWLEAGTLLGAVRDGKIIEWDNDIDLSMWSEDADKLFLALHELKRRKFKATVEFPLDPKIQLVKLRLFPFDCPIDIDLWQVNNDSVTHLVPWGEKPQKHAPVWLISHALRIARHYLCSDIGFTAPLDKNLKGITNILEYFLPKLPWKLKTLLLNLSQCWKLGRVDLLYFQPKRYFEKLGTIKIYDMIFNVPLDAEDYLKYHYGENWRIPQKKWDYLKDDKAFSSAQNWLKTE